MKRKYSDEIDSWFSDDHTFCLSECNFVRCWRHPSQIIDHSIPHSFAYLKETPDCELELMKKKAYEPDEEGK